MVPSDAINGIRMHYEVCGEGTPVVFIHPPVTPGTCFSNQVAYLQQQFQVVTFDLRGHGESEEGKEPFSYTLIAKDIAGLLDHLQIDKAVVCGYSTGGQITLEFALRYPERLIGCVLIAGIHAANAGMLATMARVGAFSTKYMMPVAAVGLSMTNANDVRQFRKIYRLSRKSLSKAATAYFRNSLTYDCTTRLHEIAQPVLLIYGERDHWALPYGNTMQRLLPNNEFVMIAKAGHRLPSQVPDELNQLIANFVLRHNEYLPMNQLTMLAQT